MSIFIHNYFEATFTYYLTQQLERLLRETPEKFVDDATKLEAHIYTLFKNYLPKLVYLQHLMLAIQAIYSKYFTRQKQFQRSKLWISIQIYLLLFQTRIIDEISLYQSIQLQNSNLNQLIINSISDLKIICQFQGIGSLIDTLSDIMNKVKPQISNHLFNSRLRFILEACDLEVNKYCQLFKQQQGQRNISIKQLNNNNVMSISTPNKKERIQSPFLSFSNRKQSQKQTPSTLSCIPLSFTVKKKQYPLGRTIYMSHPSKYLRKNTKEKIRRYYQYVENSMELL